MIGKIKSSLESVKDIYQVFYIAIVGAGLLHFVFFLTFYFLNIQALSILNLLSCLVYFVCIRLFIQSSKAEDFRLVIMLASIEVVIHAYLASYYIGLQSGFHCYLIVLSIIPIINARIAVNASIIKLLLLIITYVMLFVLLAQHTPLIKLDEAVLLTMQSFNISVLIATVGLISLRIIQIEHQEKSLLSHLATTDKLTGLYNRHGFMTIVDREVNQEMHQVDALSILVLDVDLFKEINDQYGHQCGDYVLSKLAAVMRSALSKHEMIARWGGDEFIMLLPDTDQTELTILAERLRQDVAQTKFIYQHHEIFISVTIGGATYQPGDSFETLASRADKALYQGKGSGGNAFMLHPA